MRWNYNALHVLKTDEPRLRKAIITNCNKCVICISECVLNVLNGNIRFSGCKTRKLKKYMSALHKVADRHVLLSAKKRVIVQRVEFLLSILCAIRRRIAILNFKLR